MSDFERRAWRGDTEFAALVTYESTAPEAHAIRIVIGDDTWSATATDPFSALVEARQQLDACGILIGVEGCRLQSFPTGSRMQHGWGRSVVRLDLGERGQLPETHDLFDPADRDDLATVVEQHDFFARWLEGPGGPQPLRPIAEAAAFGVSGNMQSGFLLADAGGEIRYALTSQSGTWLIERAERSSGYTFEAEVTGFEHVLRFMLLELGNTMRQNHGFRPIWIDGFSAVAGYTAAPAEQRESLLVDGATIATFYRNSASTTANRFSRIAGLDPVEVLESYLHPSGEPHLARWVQSDES